MRDERAYLADIVVSAQMIQRFLAGKTFEEFAADQLLQEAVLRRLGIIGEAAAKTSAATLGSIAGPPWQLIIRMRNVLVHVYFAVDLRTVWETAVNDLAPLAAAVSQYLTHIDGGSDVT